MTLPSVPLHGPLREARFVERPNRFVVRCRLGAGGPGAPNGEVPASTGKKPVAEHGGEVVDAHLADPGRLEELLLPDARVWLRPADDPRRKTRWSAVLVESGEGGLVSVDTTLPNRLIRAALEADALEEFAAWELERAEWSHRGSRFDFLLADESGERHLVVEVKSVTLVEDGEALFPDAVTARGARHVRELAEIAGRPGWEAAVLFVLQRPDAARIRAARSIDPDFADALAEARRAGVRVLGRRCRVELDRVTLGEAVPAA